MCTALTVRHWRHIATHNFPAARSANGDWRQRAAKLTLILPTNSAARSSLLAPHCLLASARPSARASRPPVSGAGAFVCLCVRVTKILLPSQRPRKRAPGDGVQRRANGLRRLRRHQLAHPAAWPRRLPPPPPGWPRAQIPARSSVSSLQPHAPAPTSTSSAAASPLPSGQHQPWLPVRRLQRPLVVGRAASVSRPSSKHRRPSERASRKRRRRRRRRKWKRNRQQRPSSGQVAGAPSSLTRPPSAPPTRLVSNNQSSLSQARISASISSLHVSSSLIAALQSVANPCALKQ